MTLPKLRAEIDALDDRILELLKERADIAQRVAEAKRAANVSRFHAPEREREVIERLYAKGAGAFPRDAIRVVFREIMSACLSLQTPMHVAYLGPEGTFTQMAARQAFGLAARYREAATIDGVFDAVARGDAAYGVVPLENSTEGAVSFTADALALTDLLICRELVMPIEHCLLSALESLSGISRIYSHPQALAQCRAWLAKNVPTAQVVQSSSTAAAVLEAKADERGAAIASRLAGELYGVPVLGKEIQDHTSNATRFVVLAKEDASPTGDDKTSLVFGTRDEEGALRKVLSIFESHGLSLSRIESRPNKTEAWQYVFLADFAGHREDARVKEALAELGQLAATVRILGSYPRFKAST
ncbi:MAG: prephenate dehydratase [Polyangiaceae bacterium]